MDISFLVAKSRQSTESQSTGKTGLCLSTSPHEQIECPLQLKPLETGSEVVSLTVTWKKKTLNYAAWYSVAAYLSVSFLWNISLLFLMLSLLYPSNCLFNETALMHAGLHFSFFSIPLATFYLPYIQLTCSPSDLSVHVSTHFYIYLLLF